MTPTDHTDHETPVEDCFRCRVRDSLTPVPKDAMMTKNISFRIPKELHQAVQDKAKERRDNVSDILRAALEEYVKAD